MEPQGKIKFFEVESDFCVYQFRQSIGSFDPCIDY